MERNEKRKREGKAKMAAWQEEKARRKAVREEAGKENLRGKAVRSENDINYRLRRQAWLDDLIDAVEHDGRSIYCQHLREVGQLEDNRGFFPGKYSEPEFEATLLTCYFCSECGFFRRSSLNIGRQPACSLTLPTLPKPSLISSPPCARRFVFFKDGSFEKHAWVDGDEKLTRYGGNHKDNPLRRGSEWRDRPNREICKWDAWQRGHYRGGVGLERKKGDRGAPWCAGCDRSVCMCKE